MLNRRGKGMGMGPRQGRGMARGGGNPPSNGLGGLPSAPRMRDGNGCRGNRNRAGLRGRRQAWDTGPGRG